jgi:hypothetical protein
MRARESTKERMLGEKRCGIPGRTAPHYEHNEKTIVSNTEAEPDEAKKRYHTYQHKEDGPWRKNERGEESRDGAKGEFWFRTEGMHKLGAWMI